jgi:hypothetical protein
MRHTTQQDVSTRIRRFLDKKYAEFPDLCNEIDHEIQKVKAPLV